MDSKKIETPVNVDTMYKVHCLDEHGLLRQEYIFSGKETDERFSASSGRDESGRDESGRDESGREVSQQIHPDDSIRVIKNKIIQAIGQDNVAYNELYLFIKVHRRVNILEVYQQYTQNDRTEFSKEHAQQLLRNLNTDPAVVDALAPQHYHYDTLIGLLDDPSNETRLLTIPVGQKFSHKYDPMFSANPYDLRTPIYNPSKKNHLQAFENTLLLNYGTPIDNIIYVCFAEDVFRHAIEQAIDESTIAQTYFPLLFETDEIDSAAKLLTEKPQILKKSIANINKNADLLYKSINLFYKIFQQRTRDLSYVDRGIISYSLLLHTNIHSKLPLEIIFKNMHATASTPFIKYNPGAMRENIYRFYVEKISKNGKKIPMLSENTIMQLSRKIGKRHQISLMNVGTTDHVYMDFEPSGNIRIYGECKTPKLPSELSEMIQVSVNPLLQSVNDFLQKSGYSIPLFRNLYDQDIEVVDMKYRASMVIDSEVSLQKYIKCLHGLFIIYESNISKIAKLVYKRVENFHEMDAQHLFIKDLYKNTDDVATILQSIMEKFQTNQDNAQKMLGEYLKNKDEYIEDNPGFQTIIRNEPLENKIIIEVDNISHIGYIQFIHMYVDSFLRITQHKDSTGIPKETIDLLCKNAAKIANDADKTHIQNVVDVTVAAATVTVAAATVTVAAATGTEAAEAIDGPLDEDDTTAVPLDDDLLDEPFDDELYYEDENEEGDALFQGGAKSSDTESPLEETEYKMDPTGESIHNPNLFEERMKKREPLLFTTKSGKFINYSKMCQSSAKKQPVILTQEEKDKIDAKDQKIGSKSYQHAIKYAINPEKPHWYICPRYWCLQTNTSMTEEEVKAGKCGTKPYPHNIIPDEADVVPEGAYVIEFKSKKHVNKDGSYKFYNPGVLSHKTDDGHCIPCCYGEWKSGLWQKNKEKCPAKIEDDEEEPAEEPGKRKRKAQTKKQENYLMGIDKFPIGNGRWGLLPFSVQSFLQTDNAKCISKTNQLIADNNTQCLLRHGVEKSDTQSFLSCMAAMYAYKQNLDTVPSLAEFKTMLVETITLDMFISYHNASLVSTFKPKRIYQEDIDFDKYSNTRFIESINMNDIIQVSFLEDTIASFENFLSFLQNETVEIDHHYLWDMATQDHPKIMKGGFNLVILEITKDDTTDNMQIVCPSHSQSSLLYDPTKETTILIMQTNKQGTYFEPIYMYSEDADEIKYAFTEQTAPDNLKYMLSIIQKTTNKYCAPYPSLPKQYFFKKNINAADVLRLLKSANYNVNIQVLNYQSKVIGLYASDSINSVYVPCYPSAELPQLDKWWMDDDDLWHDYETTRNMLVAIHKNTGGKVMCLPKFKVLEDGMIVGLLTETNQFVQISPLSENIFEDGLIPLDSHNYMVADKVITTSHSEDTVRTNTIRKIELETQFYSLFRTLIRQRLHEYENREIKKQIVELLDNTQLLYTEKLNNMVILLHKLLRDRTVFATMDAELLEPCNGQGCIAMVEENQFVFPKTHLLSGVDNEVVYYGRVSDELLRYRRVQLFMLNPTTYLNIGYSEYSIYDTEMLMLQSLLTPDYFRDLVVFNNNEYLKNVDHTNAIPSVSQYYPSQPISVEDQKKISAIEKKPGELNLDCVQRIRDDVQGNERTLWKRIFPKPAKEVVFYENPFCSFSMMIYIIEKVRGGKVAVNLTVTNIKSLLWTAYQEYLGEFSDNIMAILKMQGKSKLLSHRGATFEQMIASEAYFLTDLDIWVLAAKLRLPIVLFSGTSVKTLMDPTKKIDWVLLGGNVQTDSFYFIRSPNKIMEYQMVIPAVELTTPIVKEFYTLLQQSIVDKKENVQDLRSYLRNYKQKILKKVVL
jgi:hypothetical protein